MIKRMTTPVAYRHGNGASNQTATLYDDAEDAELLPKMKFERRTKRRFPIELPAEICIRETRFRGTTVNISSGGLLIKCSYDKVKLGTRVKVRLTNWPGSTGKKSDVVLVIEGAVVRDSTGYLAVRRTRWEFTEDWRPVSQLGVRSANPPNRF